MPATKTETPQLPSVSKELYQSLKADIAARGILVPLIYCSKTKTVIDGKVRLMIADQLAIKNIPKIFIGNLDGSEKEDIRTALNGLRRQLTRDQLRSIIEWAIRKEPDLSDRSIAKRTGASDKTVGKVRFQLGSEIPQLTKRKGSDGKTYSSTRKPLVFTHHASASNEATKALDRLGDKAPSGVSSLRKLRKMAMQEDREDELKKSGPTLPKHFDIRCCDFRDLVYPDSSVDLLVLDPPWHTEKHLRQPFAETVMSLLKPGGFAVVYTGHAGLLDFGDHLRTAGLTYRWLITCINEDRHGAIRKSGSVFNESRIVLLFQKPGGKFKSHSIFRDIIRTEIREKNFHLWQQPLSESIAFVKAFSKPGQLICDLTLGSGTVAEAVAHVGGGRRFLGCEIRADLVALAKRRVAEAIG
jgi:tRNA G46 methylase TrmB